MAYTLLAIFSLIAITEGTIRPFQNGAFCEGPTTSLQQRRLPMEESSIPWHFKRYGVHSPYFKTIYLLFIFSIGLLFIVQIASGAETLKAPSAKIEQHSPSTTLASSSIAITPVRKSKSDRFNRVIKRAADRYEVDPALIKAVIMAESAYNPEAVSKQGAKGLMQLMPGTARALGVKNAFDPSHNINGGAKYLRQLLNTFDENIKLALAAYNAGISKVKRHGEVPPIKATQRYVKKVFAYYHHYKSEMADQTKEV
jgi:soluble lytic murein transglycosylase-like protein